MNVIGKKRRILLVSDNIVLRKSINIIFQRFHSLMKVVVLCSQIFDPFIQIVNV